MPSSIKVKRLPKKFTVNSARTRLRSLNGSKQKYEYTQTQFGKRIEHFKGLSKRVYTAREKEIETGGLGG